MNHSNHSGLVTSYDIVCNHWFRVQGMACCLFGNKSLPKPILTSSQWNLFEQFQWKFNQYFHAIKCIWKCLQIVGHFNVPPNRKISHRNFCQWKASMPGIKNSILRFLWDSITYPCHDSQCQRRLRSYEMIINLLCTSISCHYIWKCLLSP